MTPEDKIKLIIFVTVWIVIGAIICVGLVVTKQFGILWLLIIPLLLHLDAEESEESDCDKNDEND